MGIIRSFFEKIRLVAIQVQLKDLEPFMQKLYYGEISDSFFGICASPNICIYFTCQNKNINIEFEVIYEEQKKYISKIKEFAISKGYNVLQKTYGSTPEYSELKNALIYKIEINADVGTAILITNEIMTSIFNCSESTYFEIVS